MKSDFTKHLPRQLLTTPFVKIYQSIMVSILCAILMSCVWDNVYVFRVQNLTQEDLTIATSSIITTYRVHFTNSSIRDSTEAYYDKNIHNPTDTVFVVPPHTEFNAVFSWQSHEELRDTPESDGVEPGWKFIKSMKINGSYLSPRIWNTEQRWTIKKTLDNCEVFYTLVVDDEKIKESI